MIDYKVINKPSENLISLNEIKDFLALINVSDTSQDIYLKSLLNIATKYVEDYTGRDLFLKKYLTYRINFCEFNERFYYDFYTLKTCQVESIESIKYLDNNNIWNILDTEYYNLYSQQNDWAKVKLNIDSTITAKDVINNVKIQFLSGFGYVLSEIKRDTDVIIANTINDNGLCVGDRIVISDTGDSTLNGIFYISSIVDEKTFTINNTGDDVIGSGSYMTVNNVPYIYIETIKRLIAWLFENKGDCGLYEMNTILSSLLYTQKITKLGIY